MKPSQVKSIKNTSVFPLRSFWIITFLCSAVLVILGCFMYPVPDGDSIWFVPPIKSFALDGHLENKLLDNIYTTDPKGLGRFLYYPPGLPLFIGGIASFFGLNSFKSIFILLSIVRSASLFVFVKSLLTSIRNLVANLHSVRIKLIVFLLIVSNAFFLFATNGRPEVLSILVVSTAVLVAVSIDRENLRHLLIQLCIGILFSISIANGFIGLSYYLLYLFFDVKSSVRRLRFFACSVLISLLLLLLSYALAYSIAGIDILDGIRALHSASQDQLTRTANINRIFYYWRTWFLFGLMATVSCLQSARLFFRKTAFSFLDLSWFVFSVVIIAGCIFFFGLRSAPIHYNLYSFLPIYQLLSLRLLLEAQSLNGRFWEFLCSGLLIAALILSLLNPARVLMLFPYYLISGSTYDEIKEKFEGVFPAKCAVVYTASIAFLDDSQSGSNYLRSNLSGIIPTERMKSEGKSNMCVIAFVQEVNSNVENKPPISMKLVVDMSDRSPYTNKLRSLRLLNSPKGYSFKAYKRDGSNDLN